jgi:autotransporter-associated beta strand protein|uniref:autotransporter-associated beta strand repeat-containing protein n=1 Tax=Prosthecobacter sp. TaxID=1965333 RepID=UPI00378359BE
MKRPVAAALIVISPLWIDTAQASTFVWDTTGSGSYIWQDFTNWNGGLIPTSIVGDTANLNLDILGTQFISLDDALTLGTLNIGDATGGSSIVLTSGVGGTLSFNGGATAAINKTGSGTAVIQANVGLQNQLTLNVDAGILVLDGLVDGVNGFTKNGEGTLVLRRANTYTGLTILNNGMTMISPANNDLAVLGGANLWQGTVVNSGATLAINNDATNLAGDTTGGANNPEQLLINGQGFRNMGALRSILGRESNSFSGTVTLGSAARVQSDYNTLTLTGSVLTNNHELRMGGAGFTSITGPVVGAGEIIHYGVSGFRMQNVTTAQNFTGTLSSVLGDIRADTAVGSQAANTNPYNNISALNLRDSWLRIVYAQGAGAPATNDKPDSRFSTTAPISMKAGQIYLENAAFSTGTNLFDYAVSQTFGAVTLESGFNRIGGRSADTGSTTLTFAEILKPNAGTALEFYIDSLVGSALGIDAKHRIINSALETAGVNVPFIGGWAYSSGGTANPEFVKYNTVGLGGFGYTPLTAGDYKVDQAEVGWVGTDNIKLSAGGATITANRTIQSLSMQSSTARALAGNAGTVLEVGSGGILTSLTTHTISVPTITAGAASNYELYDIAWASNVISSVIADNSGNPVSLVKTGGGTTSFFGANTYTGTTYLNEGMFRDVIGSNRVALGSGNLTFGGSPNIQAAYETDRNFTRALGTGVGEVQIIGGGGAGGGSAGFSAFGAPIDVNFGGAGATVTWGSATFNDSSPFNPGIFTLNGGNATHVVTLVNNLDLGGEQRYIRLDGNASAGNRAVIGTISGDITNGGIVKRGGGVLMFDSSKSYQNATLIQEGELWLRGNGTAGANVMGNDILIGAASRLKLDGPSNVGSNQMIMLQNASDTDASAIAFGAGYGTGDGITFSSLINNGGIPQTGPLSVLLANQQTGADRRNRVAIQISGNHDFQTDILAQIKAVAPDVEAWFGADTGNGTYTGATLSANGRNKAAGFYQAFRLGTGSGTITIANANVLNGAFALIVGAEDQTARTNIGGFVYLPQAQNYTGTLTTTIGTAVTYGTLIGAGGVLFVGQNGALNAADNTILFRGGELRVALNAAQAHFGQTDTQYAVRNLDIRSTTGSFRPWAISGGTFGNLTLNNLTMRMDDADRAFVVGSAGTTYIHTMFNGTTELQNGTTARNAFFDIGSDNSFQSGIGLVTLNGVVSQTGSGAVNLQKRQGGALILTADNTYNGFTQVQQGRLVLANTGAAGNEGSNIVMEMQNDRRGDLEFRMDGAGPFVFNNNIVTSGNDGGETRVITVGSFNGMSSNQTVQLAGNFTIGHGGTHVVDGGGSSAIYFDGFNGYQFEVTGTTNLNRDIVFRTRGALTTLSGVVAGAAGNDLEKSEQGTLWLSNNNTYLGGTILSNGYLVAAHDNAFGAATSDVTFRSTVFSQILASGARTISRNFINTATGSIQTLGGLDAGAKLFTGNINLSTSGLNLTSITGGDVTFSGVISGAGATGITKVGTGTVILNPGTGTGNSFTGGVTVSNGTLVGQAQATSGSPFGVAASPFTVANGTLRLNGSTGATNTTTTGALTVNTGNAALVVNDGSAVGTQFTFGSLARSNAATLTLKGVTTNLGTAGLEKISFTVTPTLLNDMIGTWAVIQGAGADNSGHYATMSVGNVFTHTYDTTGDLGLAAGGATTTHDAGGTASTLLGNQTVYALRTNANVDMGVFTLNLGAAHAGTLGQAGLILNAGAGIGGLPGSQVNFGTNVLSVYTDDAAASIISAPITNFRNNASNTLATVFVKYGPGTLQLGGANTFQGNVQVNQGTLSLTDANVLRTFGNLNAVTGSVVTIQPGATVLLNNNNQEFGNLGGTSVINAVQNTGGTLNLGTATLVVGRESSNQTYSGQIIGGVGSKITKIGGGRLTLDNWDTLVPNSLGTLDIAQGFVESWVNDQSWASPTGFVSSIPNFTNILLRGGEWEVRAIGDNTGDSQRILIGNNIIHQGGNSYIDVNRPGFAAGSSKLLTFGTLSLDVQYFGVTGGNTYIPRFDGLTTLTNHARIITDVQLVLAGGITDGGKGYTLNKIGASDLTISGNNTATWTGGTVVSVGTLLFGSRGTDDILFPGVTFVPSSTANAGSGDIVVNQAFTLQNGQTTAIRLNSPSNVVAGQDVLILGSEKAYSVRVDLGADAPLTSYNLRSTTNGTLALGLGDAGLYTQTLDQAQMGNGKWGLSAYGNTFYMADTLGAGVDNTYRFLGTNAATLSLVQDNVLTGTASVQVGRAAYDTGFQNPTATVAIVRAYGTQDYTGNTTIFRGADFAAIGNYFEVTNSIASPNIDIYGRLNLRGAGRVTDDAGLTNTNNVKLRPGGVLRLDYSLDVNDQFVVSRLNNSNLALSNKWGDTTAMTLDGAGLNLVAAFQHYTTETVGAITVKGGAGIYLERNSTNGGIALRTSNIIRFGQATLAIRENADELGLNQFQSQRVYVTDPAWLAANSANSMLDPWMVNATRGTFLSYNTTTGMTNAAWSGTGTGAAFLATLTNTSIAQYTAGDATLAGTYNTYALRINHEAASNDSTISGTGQINIHSGGLFIDNRDNARVDFGTTAAVYFGDGTTPTEGIIYVDENVLRFQGSVTAAGLTTSGPGAVQIASQNNTGITGTVQVNSGILYLDWAGTGAGPIGNSTVRLHADHLNNNNASQMPVLALRTDSASRTYNNSVIISENVPLARIDTNRYTGTSSGNITIQNLTIEGTSTLQGTLLQFQNNNSYNLIVGGTTTISGTSQVGLYVSAGTTQLTGTITSAAGITKTGDGVLRLDANNTGLTGDVTLNRGEIRLQGTGTGTVPNNAVGTGDFISNFGTIRLASSVADHDFFVTTGQTIFINGQTTITLDRNGGSAAVNKYLGDHNDGQMIVTNNNPFLITNGSDGLVIEAGILMNDILNLRTDITTYIRDVIQGRGKIVKMGNYLILDQNDVHTFSGGYDAYQGVTLLGHANTVLGTGAVRFFSGTYLSTLSTVNLGTTGLTMLVNSSSAMTAVGVRTSTVANFNAISAAVAAPGVFKGTGAGILSIDANATYSADLLMATRDGGFYNNWFLGGGNGNGNLTANSVEPWGAGGAEFRLGGAGGTLTLNPGTVGAQFSGGNRMLLGAGMNVNAYGFVAFANNANNTYSGGSLLSRTRHYDGGYRGFGLSLAGGNNGTRTPLGTGEVDIFGEVRVEGAAGTAVGAGGNNANQWILHPSSRLRFDYATPYTGTNLDGRWGDNEAITIDGGSLELLGDDAAAVVNTIQYRETVGAVTAKRGADISVVSRGAFYAELTLADLTRDTVTSATLTLRHNANRLGVAGLANAERLIVTAWAGSSPLMNNNMIDPWIVSRSEHQFLKYDTVRGFELVTAGGAPANYKTFAGGTLNGTTLSLNDGTEILNLTTATTTLGINADVHALRLDRDINVSADGQFNRIIIRSGGLLLGSSQTPTINPDLYFGASGLGDGEAIINTSVNTLQINGKIFASQVTKSGLSALNIRGDQSQFGGDWVIQDGIIQFLTPDSVGNGSNQIILGGGHMNDNDNYLQSFHSEVRFTFNSGTPDLFIWNTGKITNYDIGRVYTPTASDRLVQIADIDLRTTNTVAGAGQEGVLFFQVDSLRSVTRTGTVTLFDHYLMHVEAGSFGPGSTVGVQLGSGTGLGGLNNGGLYDFRKVGDGMLILGDNSGSFTGGRTFTAGEGGVRVTHNGAFGNATINAIINPTAALEIAVSNWTPTANLTQAWGSIERWAVSDARGTGNFTLAEGVHLQVYADLVGTRRIDLNGGAIMGYLPLDYEQVAVIQTVRSGVTLNLTSDSFLGQIYPAGTSNGQNSMFYDMGKLNTTTNLNPNDPGLRGSYLQIDGNITGNFNLTKVGQDIIKLSGTANTYGSTSVENGILQIGANNVLPLGGTLTTKFSGMFDLNGYNQEVAGLTGDGGSVNNGGFDNNTLTVNQAANTTYGGQVNGNVTLRKKSAGKLTFTAVNSHRGGTEIEGGTISVAQASSLGYVSNAFRAAALRFLGGALEVTANTTLAANSGVTVDAGGGTIATTAGTTFTIASAITGTGDLTKTGTGTLALTGSGSDLSGDMNVTDGTLLGGAANAFSSHSRVVITGDTASGTLDLGGFSQTIGSLASTGATQVNASVILGSSTLSVGGDGTSDAVYAGAITGNGVFRVSTHGAQTLSTVDHSAQSWSTEIANGRLSVTNDGKLGSGSITLGIAPVTGTDDMTVLNLQGVTLANNIIVNNTNSAGVSVIQSTGADSAITGNVTLNRDTFVGVQALTGLVLGGANVVSGTGRITMVDGGNLLLSGNNTYGSGVSGSAGTLIDGGTIVRSGRIELSSSSALGAKHVELGDTRTVMTTIIDRASTASLTAGGGVFDAIGGSAQSGSFTGVSSTVDGNTYGVGDVGKTILVKNEETNPTRNGIYTIVSVSGGTMNLVRHVEFDAPSEMTYGTQFAVVNGTSAGKHFFMMQNDADECCLPVEDSVRFREEFATNNVALVITADALNISNAIDVNATAGTGSVTLGGDEALTTGAATFSGNVALQNLQAGATGIETKTVTLTSATNGSSTGITFSGVISEADAINDTLSVEKTGNGTVTLTGANTYHGTTHVTDGTLQLGTGGSINDTTFIRIDSGATFGTAVGGYITDATVSGVGTISGDITIGSNVGSINTTGSLRAGDSTGGLLANAGDQLGTLTINGNLTIASGSSAVMQLGGFTLNDDPTIRGFENNLTGIDSGIITGWENTNTVSLHDHILVNGGSAPVIDGTIKIAPTFLNGYTPVFGDIFDLMDWTAVSNLGGATSFDFSGVVLGSGLAFNTQLFASNGFIVVVPEPSRALLLLFGLLGLFFRRRRASSI